MIGLRSSFRKRAGCRADMAFAEGMAVAEFVATFSVLLLQPLRMVPVFGMNATGLVFRSPLWNSYVSTDGAALDLLGHLRAKLPLRDEGVSHVGAS